MDSGKKLYSVRRWRRTVGVVFLAAIIAFIDLTAMVASVEADSISNGLTSEGNQLWQQDSYVLDGDPEGHLFVPTGGKAGSYRKRGDEFGAGLATGDFNGDGLDDLAIAAPDEDAPTHNTDLRATNQYYQSLKGYDVDATNCHLYINSDLFLQSILFKYDINFSLHTEDEQGIL